MTLKAGVFNRIQGIRSFPDITQNVKRTVQENIPISAVEAEQLLNKFGKSIKKIHVEDSYFLNPNTQVLVSLRVIAGKPWSLAHHGVRAKGEGGFSFRYLHFLMGPEGFAEHTSRGKASSMQAKRIMDFLKDQGFEFEFKVQLEIFRNKNEENLDVKFQIEHENHLGWFVNIYATHPDVVDADRYVQKAREDLNLTSLRQSVGTSYYDLIEHSTEYAKKITPKKIERDDFLLKILKDPRFEAVELIHRDILDPEPGAILSSVWHVPEIREAALMALQNQEVEKIWVTNLSYINSSDKFSLDNYPEWLVRRLEDPRILTQYESSVELQAALADPKVVDGWQLRKTYLDRLKPLAAKVAPGTKIALVNLNPHLSKMEMMSVFKLLNFDFDPQFYWQAGSNYFEMTKRAAFVAEDQFYHYRELEFISEPEMADIQNFCHQIYPDNGWSVVTDSLSHPNSKWFVAYSKKDGAVSGFARLTFNLPGGMHMPCMHARRAVTGKPLQLLEPQLTTYAEVLFPLKGVSKHAFWGLANSVLKQYFAHRSDMTIISTYDEKNPQFKELNIRFFDMKDAGIALTYGNFGSRWYLIHNSSGNIAQHFEYLQTSNKEKREARTAKMKSGS